MSQISVIVPVYKVEQYLHRCVDSILSQTFPDFELILVDDGSPDGCGAICDEYAKKDSRVVVIHQENGGLSAARNAGIDWAFANSDSQWLSFVDSDDWVHPKFLEALWNAVSETKLSVSVCSFERTPGIQPTVDVEKLSPRLWEVEPYYCQRDVEATVAWNKLYKKNCFQTIRYPVGRIHEDEFTTYKILFAYEKIAVVDQPLYAYFFNPQSIMNSPWSPKRLDSLDAYSEQISFFEEKYKIIALERMKKYLIWLSINIHELEKVHGYDDTRKTLRKELKNKLPQYWQIVPQEHRLFFLEAAYPRLMWFYWSAAAQIRKITKRRD